MYCKLPTNGKQLPAFPLEAVPGIEPQPQRWEARVLPLCHHGPSNETDTVVLEKQLEGTRITRKVIPKVTSPSLKKVAPKKQKHSSMPIITPTQSCSANLYRHIKRRVRFSLRGALCKGNLVPSRKQVAYKLPGTKSGLSGPKRVSRPLPEQHSSHSYRKYHKYSGSLYKQEKRHDVRPTVCPTIYGES